MMGIEAFIHDGPVNTLTSASSRRCFRMPILLVTSSLDGKLTAPSILLAWMATGLFSSLMLWRLRILIRGEAQWAGPRPPSFGVLMATIMGGSVIPLSGRDSLRLQRRLRLERPTDHREPFCDCSESWSDQRGAGSDRQWGAHPLAADLNRTPTGYACVIGAALVAAWFAFGKGRHVQPALGGPTAGSGHRGLCRQLPPSRTPSSASRWGSPWRTRSGPASMPIGATSWPPITARLSASISCPSTAWAYLQPFGLRLTGLFPFITPPTAPAAALNGAVLEWTYPTASIPATMPLLFIFSLWGADHLFSP